MAQIQILLLLLLLIVSLLSLPLPSLSQNPNPNPNPSSAYDELTRSGFPAGLLPANVRGYSIDRATGEFDVDLAGVCRVTLPPGDDLAAYSPSITGRLAEGRISDLRGIRVRAFFRWWGITGIRAAGDDLVLELGAASVPYPARYFAARRACEGARRHPECGAVRFRVWIEVF